MKKSDKRIKEIITQALKEDIEAGDITTLVTVNNRLEGEASIIAKGSGVLCGVDIVCEVFKSLNKNIRFKALKKDGAVFEKNDVVASIKGRVRPILTAERVALNFLSLLSGIATSAHSYVERTKSTKVKILDTRKTTPNLRALEKYAVKTGGGYNHRGSLSGGILVKDNHLKFSKCIQDGNIDEKKIEKMIKKFKKKTNLKIEIEVESLNEFAAVVKYGPHIIMLDNFKTRDLKKCVALRNKYYPKIKLEASGGVNLKNVKAIAKTGVDFVSVGSITHSSPIIDFSLDIA